MSLHKTLGTLLKNEDFATIDILFKNGFDVRNFDIAFYTDLSVNAIQYVIDKGYTPTYGTVFHLMCNGGETTANVLLQKYKDKFKPISESSYGDSSPEYMAFLLKNGFVITCDSFYQGGPTANVILDYLEEDPSKYNPFELDKEGRTVLFRWGSEQCIDRFINLYSKHYKNFLKKYTSITYNRKKWYDHFKFGDGRMLKKYSDMVAKEEEAFILSNFMNKIESLQNQKEVESTTPQTCAHEYGFSDHIKSLEEKFNTLQKNNDELVAKCAALEKALDEKEKELKEKEKALDEKEKELKEKVREFAETQELLSRIKKELS
jgi:hypothetical protein